MTLMDAIQRCYRHERTLIGREFMKRIMRNSELREQGRRTKPAARWMDKQNAKLNKKYRYLCEYLGVDWAEVQRRYDAYIDSFIP